MDARKSKPMVTNEMPSVGTRPSQFGGQQMMIKIHTLQITTM